MNRGPLGMVRCELERMGGSCGAIPEVDEVVLESRVPEIERVEIEDMVVGSFAKCNGEPPVYIVMVV